MNILINVMGIQDSGGITVLDKLFDEIKDNKQYTCLIICYKNKSILKLTEKLENVKNVEFKLLSNKGFVYRMYYENIVFRKIIKEYNIELVYNFSGTAQFFSKVSQITKVHNLLFYSKKMDKVYFEKKEYLMWFKQIFLKRVIFHLMLNQTKYVEVQSDHVQKYISAFLDISTKSFYIKSDISFEESEFSKPRNYNFSNKIKFLYIVGPHFEYLHKNFIDFTNVMLELKKMNIDFEINITLTKRQLDSSDLWDTSLNDKTNFLGYVSDEEEMNRLFCDNTVLISTSIIETLGLHVIEAIKKGIIPIAPSEKYSYSVYGENIITYDLFNTKSLLNSILSIINNKIDCQKNILMLQNDLKNSEENKCSSVVDIFSEILKD